MSAPVIEQPRLLTAQQVADRTGLSLWSVYHYARVGTLPSKRLGRSVRFLAAEVDAAVTGLPPGGPR